MAARELETHLEDQQEEFLAEGHPPEEAERLAVEDMGDPVAVGADLDRLHRPRPQWGMLGLTLALLLVGGWLRYALTRAGAPWDEDLDPLRCALSVVTGAAVLVGAYFLDVSRLLRWAKWVYIGAVAVECCLCISPRLSTTHPISPGMWCCSIRQSTHCGCMIAGERAGWDFWLPWRAASL